mmetsp:Transcript_133545/g.297894  ORF Transcript_133545/g.297894 Transcript_133545/m.297894 type:complete len:223 (+) Transcript_133545:411-1079(+)
MALWRTRPGRTVCPASSRAPSPSNGLRARPGWPHRGSGALVSKVGYRVRRPATGAPHPRCCGQRWAQARPGGTTAQRTRVPPASPRQCGRAQRGPVAPFRWLSDLGSRPPPNCPRDPRQPQAAAAAAAATPQWSRWGTHAPPVEQQQQQEPVAQQQGPAGLLPHWDQAFAQRYQCDCPRRVWKRQGSRARPHKFAQPMPAGHGRWLAAAPCRIASSCGRRPR